MKARVKVTGGKELARNLSRLKAATRLEELERIGLKAAEPIRAMAARLAPNDPNTPKSLGETIVASTDRKAGRALTTTPRPKPTTAQVWVGPTKEGYPEAMMGEFGAAPHKIEARSTNDDGRLSFTDDGNRVTPDVVNHPGVDPQPYMAPAWEHMGPEALNIIRREIRTNIEAEARKLNATGKD